MQRPPRRRPPASLRLLPGGPDASLVGAGALAGAYGETLTFTRATTKYVSKSDGTLVSVASGAPGVDYRGLLVEASHTNLLLQSNAFTTAPAWVDNGGAGLFTAAQAIAPDGTLTGWKVDQTSGGFYQFVNSGFGSTGDPYSPSFYMKAITTSGSLDVENPQAGAGGQWTIDLSKVSTTNWERITANHPAVTVVHPFKAVAVNQGGIFFTQVVAYQYYLWGVQLEPGSIVHSYVPTTTVAATCNKDVASLPSATLPIAAGSVEFDFTPLWSATPAAGMTFVDSSADTTAANGIALYGGGSGADNKLSCRLGAVTLISSAVLSWAAGTRYRIGMRWGAGNLYLYRDGVIVASVTDGSAAIPTVHPHALRIGDGFFNSSPVDGYISDLSFRAL